MPKKFKCPICGCDEHFKINSISDSKRQNDFSLISYFNSLHGDVYGSVDINGNFKTYVCKKCGNVQLFSEAMLSQLNEYSDKNKIEVKKISSDIKTLKEKIDEKQIELEPTQKRIDVLMALLKRDDITIKQHNEYEKELNNLCSDKILKRIKREIDDLNRELERKENELEKVKKQQF